VRPNVGRYKYENTKSLFIIIFIRFNGAAKWIRINDPIITNDAQGSLGLAGFSAVVFAEAVEVEGSSESCFLRHCSWRVAAVTRPHAQRRDGAFCCDIVATDGLLAQKYFTYFI
jgi:hypothetical protein